MNTIPAYRMTEIESRQHRFHVVTPAERKARRKRLIEAALIVVGLGAFAACCYGLCSPKPGAIINSQVAPGAPLTAENAPVRWQRSDFPAKPVKAKQNPSSKRVASNTAKNPARGSILPRVGNWCEAEGGEQVTCAFPHCRQEGSLIYLQREICPRHWNELSAADPAAELELLSKIDLTRTAQGEVVEVAVG